MKLSAPSRSAKTIEQNQTKDERARGPNDVYLDVGEQTSGHLTLLTVIITDPEGITANFQSIALSDLFNS